MKHNDQLQMQPKGNSKVYVSRAPATKSTNACARTVDVTPKGW